MNRTRKLEVLYKMNSEEEGLMVFSKSHISHALFSLLNCKLGIIIIFISVYD